MRRCKLPSRPVAQQGHQRPVRARQCVQAHHLCGGAGRGRGNGGQPFCLRGARSAWRARGFAAPTATSTAAKRWPRGWRPPATPALSRWARVWASRRSANYFAAFGLREATGIDLPGEIRRSEYYTADAMGPVELASCSLARAARSAICRCSQPWRRSSTAGGCCSPMLSPRLLPRTARPFTAQSRRSRRQVISAQTSETMRALMEGVVTDGTGKNGAVAGYRVGGKTGTSQKLDSSDPAARIASYVAGRADRRPADRRACLSGRTPQLDDKRRRAVRPGLRAGACAGFAVPWHRAGLYGGRTGKTVCRRARCDRLAHGPLR